MKVKGIKSRTLTVFVLMSVLGLITIFTGPALVAEILIYALLVVGVVIILDDIGKFQFTPFNYALSVLRGHSGKTDKSDKPGKSSVTPQTRQTTQSGQNTQKP